MSFTGTDVGDILSSPCQPSHILFPQHRLGKRPLLSVPFKLVGFSDGNGCTTAMLKMQYVAFLAAQQQETVVCSLPDRQRRAFWSAVS